MSCRRLKAKEIYNAHFISLKPSFRELSVGYSLISNDRNDISQTVIN